ncbi:MAG: MFS transporter, partial [Candidatus Methylarchaceae archaeon HK02M1]|nr:MFS transporter [Candidatus Methylarchaceae archaeon HK02M1]
LGGNAVLALIPTLKDAFNVDITLITLSITLFMVPFAFLQLFSGTISDIYNRYRVLFIGFLIYAVGSLICALSSTITIFLSARILQGFGFAFVNPVILAILGDITSEEYRGKIMGGLGSAITAGIAFGPLIAGFLAETDWRLTFILFFLLASAAGLVSNLEFRKEKFLGRRIDLRMMFSQIFNVSTQKSVVLLSISGFLVFFSMIGVMSYIPDLLSQGPYFMKDYEIGFIISMAGFAGILASPIAGVMVDRMGRIKTALFGSVIMLTTLIFLILGDSLLRFSILFSLLGFGSATVWAPFQTLAVEMIPRARGSVSSLFNSSRFFGYALAPAVLSPFYLAFSINSIYSISASLMLVCFWLVYLIGKTRMIEKNR